MFSSHMSLIYLDTKRPPIQLIIINDQPMFVLTISEKNKKNKVKCFTRLQEGATDLYKMVNYQ